jgi:hypothetical protein
VSFASNSAIFARMRSSEVAIIALFTEIVVASHHNYKPV